MNSARRLTRVMVFGLAATTLMVGGMLVQPATPAAAAVAPDGHVGAPDIGYPNCPACRVQNQAGGAPHGSGDVAYPGCPSSCRVQDEPGISLPASGDIGYPNCPSSCRGEAQESGRSPSSGDEGYPRCISGCGIEAQPVDDEAVSSALL